MVMWLKKENKKQKGLSLNPSARFEVFHLNIAFVLRPKM